MAILWLELLRRRYFAPGDTDPSTGPSAVYLAILRGLGALPPSTPAEPLGDTASSHLWVEARRCGAGC